MTPTDLKKMRHTARMTMTKLAEELKVTVSLISLWERGKAPINERWVSDIVRILEPPKAPDPEPELSSIPTKLPDNDRLQLSQKVELGLETMTAIKRMIDDAVRQLRMAPISPDVLKSAKEGDGYRAKTQEILSGGVHGRRRDPGGY
ncbi:MAG: helix-turn-helix transcriptional regulator [Nitrospirota bacterium]|nr:helix-turn-helix transcriptional regulator [Nitrospirota bacterium]